MIRKISFLIFTAIFLIAGCNKNKEIIPEKSIPVRVYTAKPDSISAYLEITGNLQAENDAQVVSMISEKLTKILKHAGNQVKKDGIIAIMENRIWKESLNQAQASLQSIKARHEQVKQDYERYQRLFQERAVSQQQWEQIQSSMQEADANLARLTAAYAQAREQFNDTFIRAPFDGVVGTIYFDEGQMIPVGQPVAKIINTNLMKTKLYVPDIYIPKIKTGQLVYATFPSFENTRFVGQINRIDPAIDPLSRTVEVKAVFQNDQKMLKSGMFGLFNIEVEKKKETIVIPDNALLNRTEVQINRETGSSSTVKNYFIFVVKNDTATISAVKPGIQSGSRVEILQGLNRGDRVIVVGQKIVKEGQKVRIVTD